MPGNVFEMVCGIGSSPDSNRKIAIISMYIPPTQSTAVTAAMKNCLTDGVNKLKSTYDNPILVVGGDTNKRPLSDLLSDFSDITVINCPPSRDGANLDETACNILLAAIRTRR